MLGIVVLSNSDGNCRNHSKYLSEGSRGDSSDSGIVAIVEGIIKMNISRFKKTRSVLLLPLSSQLMLLNKVYISLNLLNISICQIITRILRSYADFRSANIRSAECCGLA